MPLSMIITAFVGTIFHLYGCHGERFHVLFRESRREPFKFPLRIGNTLTNTNSTMSTYLLLSTYM